MPFCDNEVVRASLAVPPALNLHGDTTEKEVLRRAFEDILPAEIARRPKYALPESRDVRLYRLILSEFDAAMEMAEEVVWEVLDRGHLLKLRRGEAEVGAVERGEVVHHTLTDEQALSEPFAFRIKHLFLALTFLRWHSLYFGARPIDHTIRSTTTTPAANTAVTMLTVAERRAKRDSGADTSIQSVPSALGCKPCCCTPVRSSALCRSYFSWSVKVCTGALQ